MTNRQKITVDVLEEMLRQDHKWGDQCNLPAPVWCTILMEEVGEVAKEVLERDKEKARKELVQVAAVVCQMIDALDSGRFDT